MLVRKFGLREGETVAVVAGSSVWYPVGVWAGIRVGMYTLPLPLLLLVSIGYYGLGWLLKEVCRCEDRGCVAGV